MRKAIPILLLTCCYFYGSSQTFQDCIAIDFESIINSPSADGLTISTQFQDTFGLSFSLETGGFPVLAEVGGTRTAFGSVYGPDTPAPNQNIGSFFLTDDGVLAGLNSPPVILDFLVPVDSFSGCILDMDFGELFIIHARDINEQIILIDTILSTDPGTGDGISTCWGFNLEGCEGSVHSIRFEGKREVAGAFGMGLDNLVFCLSGIDIANRLSFETTDVACDGTLGSIAILNDSNEDLIYSIDGINFQSNPIFENLEVGSYTITVEDISGCAADINNIIIGEDSLNPLTEISILNTSCDLNNGSFEVSVNQAVGISYSLDGVTFQSSPVFENLGTGTYTVYMRDDKGCEFQTAVTIENQDLIISDVLAVDTQCNEPNGTLLVSSNLTDQVSYSIDGINFQDIPFFRDLSPGTYTVFISDNRGCMDTETASILPSEGVALDLIATPEWCSDSSGIISIQASGGSGNYLYQIDDGLPQASATFSNLISDSYLVSIEDGDGCATSQQIFVDAGEPIEITDLLSIDPSCDNLLGSIELTSEGGNGTVSYSLNGDASTFSPNFYNLLPGNFSIVIQDEQGCQDSLLTSLDLPICPIYIPNAFSPTDNGINDFFRIFTNPLYDVAVLQYAIYDRWGNQMWESGNFTIHTATLPDYWDGDFRGEACNPGVYVYKIEVQYLNGEVELYSGDVTLVR